MNGKLRNMTSIYLLRGGEVLLLFRQGGRVVNEVYTGAAGGHFEPEEVQDAGACVLRELKEEIGITESQLTGLHMKYVTQRLVRGELRLNYYFFAELSEDPGELTSNEGRLEWVKLEDAAALEMPLSAKAAWKHYMAIGRFDDALYMGAVTGEDAVFTALPVT